MSFITKRERVFNEYDLFDLPCRNEGKLKAFASCTDARAWSHFCSDKTEHLVEIIKRNNEKSRPKYVPTEVIVNTLMVTKNTEIARLKRKIEDFEHLLAAYDQLELTSEQKAEIANAHASITAANKELDDLCLDLDLSGYTEGIDSEAFETGKSRGDELSRSITETAKSSKSDWSYIKEPIKVDIRSNQFYRPETNDVSTYVYDERIEEMQDMIVSKDAKLNALQNSIAVLENDVCEPYCIYAQIYTALEKIFGILYQNVKYKQYLDLLTVGRDTRHVHIKGKILYKIKILEKFSQALISPCSQDLTKPQTCSCTHAEIVAHVETTFALTSAENDQPSLDNKRAKLVADIINIDEIRNILSGESIDEGKNENIDEHLQFTDYKINKENIERIKKLQSNYEDLLACYEELKCEKDYLYIRCQKLLNLENECECMQNKLKEYNQLWNEKEFFRRRSEELDNLKEKFYVLSDETSNLESKFKAECEINNIKSSAINELRDENISLERRLNETAMLFEKERNALMCKLKECECSIMCKDQQIKSLSSQIENLLQRNETVPTEQEISQSIQLLNEIASQKEQIKQLTNMCTCQEEEKIYFQQEFEKELELLNKMKFEVESWKSKYEEILKRNDILNTQIKLLHDENQSLSQNIDNKTSAIDNLLGIIKNKSKEIDELIEEKEHHKNESHETLCEIHELRKKFSNNILFFENDEVIESSSNEDLKPANFMNDSSENKVINLNDYEIKDENVSNHSSVHKDILNEVKSFHGESIDTLSKFNDLKNQYKSSLELTKKESVVLETELTRLKEIELPFEQLQMENETLSFEKNKLEKDLVLKTEELNKTIKQCESLERENETLKKDLRISEDLTNEYKHLKDTIQQDLSDKQTEIYCLKEKNSNLELEKQNLLEKSLLIDSLTQKLHLSKIEYDKLLAEKNDLQIDLNGKTSEMNKLHGELEEKIKENEYLLTEMETLNSQRKYSSDDISLLKHENLIIQNNLDTINKERLEINNKLQCYNNIEVEHNKLKYDYDQIILDNQKLQHDLNSLTINVQKLEQENKIIKMQNENILLEKEMLETALANSKKETSALSGTSQSFYDGIKQEVENMKKEQTYNHEKIKDLMDQVNNSEQYILNLKADISSRDNIISELQNHINSLQDEVKQLHQSLEIAIESGEDLRAHSSENIDKSLKDIGAHYSKATHNMKVELAKLQENNDLLKNKLSNAEINQNESDVNVNKYMTRIVYLNNQKEEIIRNLKQLELHILGHSNLTCDCSLIDILRTFNNIRKRFDERNMSFEDTLLKVQNSCQLLESKAEEARVIAENEKRKILTEKENLKQARINIEAELETLKIKLKEQEILKIQYNQNMQDIEAKLLNQKLIFDEIQQNKDNHIKNLEEEIQTLKTIYENSLLQFETIQQRLQEKSNENIIQQEFILKLQKDFDEKYIALQQLQKVASDVKNKTSHSIASQTETTAIKNDRGLQTNDILLYENKTDVKYDEADLDEINVISNNCDINNKNNVVDSKELKSSDFKPKTHEVQILTAKVEPSLDFAKNIYRNYKLGRLQTKSLEQYSYISLAHDKNSDLDYINENDYPSITNAENSNSYFATNRSNNNLGTISTPDDFLSKSYENTKNHKGNQYISINRESSSIDTFLPSQKDNFSDKDLHKKGNKSNTPDDMVSKSNKQHLNIMTKNENFHDDVEDTLSIISERLGNSSPVLMAKALDLYDKKGISASASNDNRNIRHLDSKSEENTNQTSTKIKTISIPSSFRDDVGKQSSDYLQTDKHSNSSVFKANLSSSSSVDHILTILNHSSNKIEGNNNSDIGNKSETIKEVYPNNVFKENKEYNISKEYSWYNNLSSQPSSHTELAKSNRRIDDDKISTAKVPPATSTANNLRTSRSYQQLNNHSFTDNESLLIISSTESNNSPKYINRSICVKLDSEENYEKQIKDLLKALEETENECKKKIESVKLQYECNVKSIIKEHNHGVLSIQSLHEDTLGDIIKSYDKEIENLRTMSIESTRKAEILKKENHNLKLKLGTRHFVGLDQKPTKLTPMEVRERKYKSRTQMLTKTNVEAFNVKPKRKLSGPCTCSLDINISDTVRSIFDQVDEEQRKLAQQTYLKHIANKLANNNIENLNAQELSFLHFKVCRCWSKKLTKEETLKMKIDSLENELITKQRETQQHISELDRKVAKERQRLLEVRRAISKNTPVESIENSQLENSSLATNTIGINCENSNGNIMRSKMAIDRCSSGEPTTSVSNAGVEHKRGNIEIHKQVSARLDNEYNGTRNSNEETPTRLRKSHNRPHRAQKKN